VLNLVYIEDYLKGVVPAEMGNQGLAELEALKAQAIASRSYALFKTARNSESEYHLESTILDQLYGGMEIEDPVVNLAVERTSGEVIVKNGYIIKAYYHACCGGSTENVEKVWNKHEESYLKKVDDKDYCSWYKRFKWEMVWRREGLERVLSFSLKDFFEVSSGGTGKLVDLQIMDRTPSGRIGKLCIGTESETYHVLKDNIRWILRDPSDSTRILPSTFFELKLVKNEKGEIEQIKMKGKGNGHGVGMCQTGAIGMARKGFSYQEILKHYYTGVEIKKIY
jgi:stage II sporulation protein D